LKLELFALAIIELMLFYWVLSLEVLQLQLLQNLARNLTKNFIIHNCLQAVDFNFRLSITVRVWL